MHPHATRNPPVAGVGAVGTPEDVAAQMVAELGRIRGLLERAIGGLEQAPDYDQTFVAGGNPAAAAVVVIQLPRTLRHVEVTLSVTQSIEVAVIDGNVPLAQAQQQHGHNAGQVGPSNAICTTSGGQVKARDFLGQSGYLTIYFVAAGAGYANLRVRDLDRKQQRAIR